MSGHACPRCLGVGTIRVRGQSGSVRVTCPECGGRGTQQPRSLIRDEIHRALAEHPAKAIGAFVATVLAVPAVWLLYVVAVVTLRGMGVR